MIEPYPHILYPNLGYIQLICTRNIYSGSACTRIANIGSIYIGNFFARDTCTQDAYLTGANIRSVDIENTCFGNTYIYIKSANKKNAYIKGASIIKHSNIYLQFFFISKVRLLKIRLKIGGGIRLEIG